MEAHDKVNAEHLKRDAYLYIRQSSLKQVFENTESTRRQYAMRERAIGLGWSPEQVVVIDSDQGESAAPGAADREGFEKLVTDVGMGRAGIVMGLEVSRLARSSSAWHRLLDICAVTDTLVLDQDGLYDTKQINDRLLLGLKAAMSEAELHLIRERMRGGALSKASRGELRVRLPVGFLYDVQGRVVLDPDKQVRESLSLFFKTFARLGSAYKTARFFHEQGLSFPKRIHCGPGKGDLIWTPLTHGRVVQALNCPRYAGAYAYGRSKTSSGPRGLSIKRDLPVEQWHTLILDAHEGYISWQDYQRHRKQLEGNAQGSLQNRKCPPREGPALLQGLVVCGLCGRAMSVRYYTRRGGLSPNYVCCGVGKAVALPLCQSIAGDNIDAAIGQLLLETLTPVALEVSLSVQQEVRKRFEEADKLRLRQVERASYEVDLARRRYMKVDPLNRLVAEELEAEWNRKLRELGQAREDYQRQREQDHVVIDREEREKILSLVRDFPRLWRNPKTPQRERKRIAQLLIQDVTLIKNDPVSVQVRFKGGATRSLTVARTLASYEAWKTSAEVVAEIDRMLEHHTYSEIARSLNQRNFSSGQGRSFDRRRINVIRRAYGLKDRYVRLRDQGFLTKEEIALKLGTTPRMVKVRRAKGTLGVGCRKLNDMGQHLYENPDAPRQAKSDGNVSRNKSGAV
jgi:DNA invertase Pin-like site-specific DNA recombinase